MRLLAILLMCCLPTGGTAVARAETASAAFAGYEQRLGSQLPLDAVFRDVDGRPHPLDDFFDGKPVVLVLGYYHCPRLCSTILDGVLESMQEIDLPHTIVSVSIDPRESSADARRKQSLYRQAGLAGATAPLHLLTGTNDGIRALAAAAGFHWTYDADSDQYTHPAGFLIATPDGRVSRYFAGVRFDRRDVRLAMVEAGDNRIGTLLDKFVLLCSHYDPVAGRYSVTIMNGLRIASVVLALSLASFVAVSRRRRRRP